MNRIEDVVCELHATIQIITLNRSAKHNAFDDIFLIQLHNALKDAIANPKVSMIVLKAQGNYFSSGADLDYMQRMVSFSEEENIQQAMILADTMYALYSCPKPTMAIVQGSAFGGGVGLIAACDIAISAIEAQFCFSEVKLGLIPAVISPYIIKAIGEKAATWLFMTAEIFSAEQAHALQLIQFCVKKEELETFSMDYAQKIAKLPPEALKACKALVRNIAGEPINETLIQKTALLIAKKRISTEAQVKMNAFLAKRKTHV